MGKIVGFKTAQDARRVIRAVKRSEQADPRAVAGGRWDGNHNVILARITGNDGAAVDIRKYSWVQVYLNSTGTVITDVPEGMSGTTTANFATDPNGKEVATEAIAALLRTPCEDADPAWSVVGIGGSLPVGNKTGQGYFMVTDETGAMTLPFFVNP